ncbi:MAG: type IV secretion system protein [Pseudomonadota bacterium]
MQLDPASISFIQSTFLQHLSNNFHYVMSYARNLLYFFAMFEVVITGLVWALQQTPAWERLFVVVFKIGFILLLVTQFPGFLEMIINTFALVASQSIHVNNLADAVFNPATIWQYGFDPGIKLLREATVISGIGFPIIYVLLGMGILLIFGLIGIQIVIQVLGFYLVATTSLLFLPLGVFNPTSDMLAQALHSVLKAGVRVMIMIMIIGGAIGSWQIFNLTNVDVSTNIVLALGLFFSGLLFLCLLMTLPRLAAEAVGKIKIGSDRGATSTTVVTTRGGGASYVPAAAAPSGSATMAAATPVSTAAAMKAATTVPPPTASVNTAVSVSSTVSGGMGGVTTIAPPPSSAQQRLMSKFSVSSGGEVSERDQTSKEDLKEIKKMLLQQLKEKKKDNKTQFGADNDEDDTVFLNEDENRQI